MGNSDVAALQSWVSNHVKDQTGVGVLTSCKNVSGTGVVNALFRAATNFNFHVNLTGPC